jgi:xanthine/CO dehydrogenase XdhC/CoxF family maturation factor
VIAPALQPAPMRSSHELALAWLDASRRVASATLADVPGSAPLDPGAAALLDDTQGESRAR